MFRPHVGLLLVSSLLPFAMAEMAKCGEPRAFVRISPRDTRYLELSDGQPYIPIGLNMIAPPGDDLHGMETWFRKLSANRGNYVRIWLGHSFFDVEHASSGEYDGERAKRIDGLLALARRYDIRLKLCLEHFRHLGEGRQTWAGKPIHLVEQGGPAKNTADFFDGQRSREQFKRKIAWFAERYGDDPIVFGWELWNEVDCIRAGNWKGWTVEMLPELHRVFPKNLAMQSLGSFDTKGKRQRYHDLCMISGNDVLQVHRYLDLGASLDVCRGPVDLLAADSVKELLRVGIRKPVLLAESGGVEPRHTGPLKLYSKDKAGILLHDVLFAPFFCGAAGPGHIWHWGVYVDQNDLWHHFDRFAEVVEGLDPAAEGFQAGTIAHPRLRVYSLKGRDTWLLWCRDPQNTWQTELAEGKTPETLHDVLIELPGKRDAKSVEVYDPWEDNWAKAKQKTNGITLPAFSRSAVVRIRRSDN